MEKVKKVSVMGLPGVGKSTLIKMITGQDVPRDYIPTVALDFGATQVGDFKVSLWDLGGQDQFQCLWDTFIPGTNTIMVVTDSTIEGVQKTKSIVEKYKNKVQNFLIIANKQDVPGALSPNEVKSILGIETHGLTAINPTCKQALFKILQQKFSS